jgi:hypothetical protein
VLRRVAVCLAFSTWCFLNCWVQLAQGGSVYYARYHPWETVARPVVCWELVVAAGMLAVWKLLPGKTATHLLFLGLSFAPVGMAAVAAANVAPTALVPLITSRLLWPALALLSIPLVIFGVRRPLVASRLLQSLFLYSWPVLAVVYVDAARASLLRYHPTDYADGPLAERLAGAPPGVRAVWIVFDEWSQAIAFNKRPAGLDLPNFDRFRSESFYATAAEPPAGFTRISIPSLLIGEHAETTPAGPKELTVEVSSHHGPVSWGALPNVFDTARQMGFNTALAGWFHPYGRLLNHSLTRCYWTAEWLPPGIEESFQPESLLAAMWRRARMQAAGLPLVARLLGEPAMRNARLGELERFNYLRNRALEIATDPSIGLVFIHLPVPHPPALYDRSLKKMTSDPTRGYLDGLALADAVLGVLRQKMEDAGLWNGAAVLISSDHSLRPSIWRDQHIWNREDETVAPVNTSGVPFLLKLPGQTGAVTYEKSFNTDISGSLLTAILAGDLKEPGEIAPFIEKHKSGLPAKTFHREGVQEPRDALGRAFEQIPRLMAQAQ